MQYEMTSGYSGTLGVRWKPADERLAKAMIAQAMIYNAITRDEAMEELARGRVLKTGVKSPNYYFDHGMEAVRMKRELATPEMVRCACGHVVPRASVMSASLGTSCPDCYDRMSD